MLISVEVTFQLNNLTKNPTNTQMFEVEFRPQTYFDKINFLSNSIYFKQSDINTSNFKDNIHFLTDDFYLSQVTFTCHR